MSRYYFHIMDGSIFIDETGVELASLEAVRAEAVIATGEMLTSARSTPLWSGEAWRMVVADSDGVIVFSLAVSVNNHGTEARVDDVAHIADLRSVVTSKS